MPINFPDTPDVDQIFASSDGREWIWTGSVWNIVTNNTQVEILSNRLDIVDDTIEVIEDSILTLDNSIDAIEQRIEDNMVLSAMDAI
jgi:hypothetical protein